MITGVEKFCKEENIIIGIINGKENQVSKKYFDKNGCLKRENIINILSSNIKCNDLQDYFMSLIERYGYTEII